METLRDKIMKIVEEHTKDVDQKEAIEMIYEVTEEMKNYAIGLTDHEGF